MTKSAVPSNENNTRHIPIEGGEVSKEVSFDLGVNVPQTQFSAHQKIEEKAVHHTVHHAPHPQTTQHEQHYALPKGQVAHFRENTTGAKLQRLSHPVAKHHKVNHLANAKLEKFQFLGRVWGIVEWLATSAAIFAILFLIINYDSYSALFWNKIAQYNGQIGIPDNPFTEQENEKTLRAAPEGQKPLPITHSVNESKKQIPPLSLQVAPPDDRIIIPRIAKNVPILRVSTEKLIKRDWAALENEIQEALRFGVVHFPGTAYPGSPGNVVITGHSSYFPWDPGRFKDVFALLHQVAVGDEIVVYHEQKPYRYKVYEKKVVSPSQVEVLTQKGDTRLTLITCTPVGTALNRLIVLAEPV